MENYYYTEHALQYVYNSHLQLKGLFITFTSGAFINNTLNNVLKKKKNNCKK